MYTRRHFEQIADDLAIQRKNKVETFSQEIEKWIKRFSESNPRFDKIRFIKYIEEKSQ